MQASESTVTNPNSQPPNPEDKEVEGTHHDPRRNIPPKKTHHTLLSSEDDNDQALVQPRKNVRFTKKRIFESDDDNDQDDSDQAPSTPVQPRSKKVRVDSNSKNIRQKKNNKKLTGESKKSRGSRKESASNDSNIEIIEKPQEETPEKELCMWIQ